MFLSLCAQHLPEAFSPGFVATAAVAGSTVRVLRVSFSFPALFSLPLAKFAVRFDYTPRHHPRSSVQPLA